MSYELDPVIICLQLPPLILLCLDVSLQITFVLFKTVS